MTSLNLGSMIQPVASVGIFADEGYYCWCPNVIRGDDGRYYLFYSRWPEPTGAGGWLTASEVALAVADRAEGPYSHVRVLLKGRGPGHWDELMAHNPRVRCFDGTYFLYYISSRAAPTHRHIRYTQRTGVAVASSISGPYQPSKAPVIEPAPPVFNVTVNPDVVRRSDGRFLMMLKGDLEPREPGTPWSQRVQGLALADSAGGPFRMLPDLAVRDFDTEDCCVWHDHRRGTYYAVFHAHTHIGLIESPDGVHWRKSADYEVLVTDRGIRKADGTLLMPTKHGLQRPSVYCETGEPRLLCLGCIHGEKWCCLLLPLSTARKKAVSGQDSTTRRIP